MTVNRKSNCLGASYDILKM